MSFDIFTIHQRTHSSRRKLIFVPNLFSPPSPNNTSILPPPWKNHLIHFQKNNAKYGEIMAEVILIAQGLTSKYFFMWLISVSENFSRGPGITNTLA